MESSAQIVTLGSGNEYRDGLKDDDYRALTKAFAETGTAPGVLAHYERLDGQGGFIVEELPDDAEKSYELTVRYGPWVEFHVFPTTSIEDAFPVIQRVYG
jgi:hypothetical protein